MRLIVEQVPVQVQEGSSGAFTTLSPPEKNMGPCVIGANNTNAQFRFLFPAGFDASDPVQGMYNPRIWVEDLIWQPGYSWQQKLVTTPTVSSTTALVSSTDVPRDDVLTENFTKATYYDATDPNNPFLGYYQIQLQTTGSATAYDCDKIDRSNPRLILEFERQSPVQLDALDPEGFSDHLWQFTQVDLYVIHKKRIAGVDYYHKHRIGWMADEDLEKSDFLARVDFSKGKPKGKVVQFASEITAMVKGQLADFDPWFLTQANAVPAVVQNNQITYTQTNKQRPIPILEYRMEWVTSSGHRVRFIIPKGIASFDAATKPGDNAISKQGFMIQPLVGIGGVSSITTITQSQVQQVEVGLSYRAS